MRPSLHPSFQVHITSSFKVCWFMWRWTCVHVKILIPTFRTSKFPWTPKKPRQSWSAHRRNFCAENPHNATCIVAWIFCHCITTALQPSWKNIITRPTREFVIGCKPCCKSYSCCSWFRSSRLPCIGRRLRTNQESVPAGRLVSFRKHTRMSVKDVFN